MMKIAKTQFTVLALFATSIFSCTTLFKAKEEAKVEKPHKEIIVQKAGDSDNQLDGKERSYWVEVNNSSKKASTKMVASLASGDAASSEIHARHLLRKSPGNPKALAILTAALAQQKNFSMAAFYARELLKREENSSLAFNVIGLSYLMTSNATMRDFKKAAEYFAKSMQVNGKETAAALNLAYLHLELGRPDLAFDSFTEAKTRCDSCFYAVIGRGISASRTGKVAIAKQEFEQILATDEKNGEAMYRLALLRKNGYNDVKGSRELLDKLINDGRADDNLKRRAYVLARKLEDTRDPSMIADRKSEQQPEESDNMDNLYQALETE